MGLQEIAVHAARNYEGKLIILFVSYVILRFAYRNESITIYFPLTNWRIENHAFAPTPFGLLTLDGPEYQMGAQVISKYTKNLVYPIYVILIIGNWIENNIYCWRLVEVSSSCNADKTLSWLINLF